MVAPGYNTIQEQQYYLRPREIIMNKPLGIGRNLPYAPTREPYNKDEETRKKSYVEKIHRENYGIEGRNRTDFSGPAPTIMHV